MRRAVNWAMASVVFLALLGAVLAQEPAGPRRETPADDVERWAIVGLNARGVELQRAGEDLAKAQREHQAEVAKILGPVRKRMGLSPEAQVGYDGNIPRPVFYEVVAPVGTGRGGAP